MATFSLMTIFLAIGGLGFLFLVLSLIIGDLFDSIGFNFDGPNSDFGVLDSRVISVFLTAFGGFGAIGVSLGFAALGGSIFGIFGGVFFAAIVFYFGKFLFSQQSSSSVSSEAMIGRPAQVIVGIRPGQLGQISCRIGEEKVEKLARTAGGDEIKAGQIVRIDSIGSDCVIVSIESDDRVSLFSDKP
jgi:hypothetical protein